MEFKVGDVVEVRNPEGSEDTDWHIGRVSTVDRAYILPYAVDFPEADDGSGWYWVTPHDIRPLPVQQEVWQFKSASATEWVDLTDDFDGLSVNVSAYVIDFRRKPKYPEHTAEEIVAKLRSLDVISDDEVTAIPRGEF